MSKNEISNRRQTPAYQEQAKKDVQSGTPPWFLSSSRFEVREGNSFTLYPSGEEVFGAIADSILNAKKSVDIVCTFFDPAMLLTRNRKRMDDEPPSADQVNYDTRDGSGFSAWAERDSFGGIIKEALRRNPNLKIRIVQWLNQIAQMKVPSVIGIDKNPHHAEIERSEGATGFDIAFIQDPGRLEEGVFTVEETRKYNSLKLRDRPPQAVAYSRQWYQQVMWEKDEPNQDTHYLFDRLCITRRAIEAQSINEEDQVFGLVPVVVTEISAEDKKCYEPTENSKSYLFGAITVTPTSDLPEHCRPKPRTEDEPQLVLGAIDLEAVSLANACDHQKTVLIDIEDAEREGSDPHGYVLGHNFWTEYWSPFPFKHRNPRNEMDSCPYFDFSMQVRGPVLIDLNKNFCEAYGAQVFEGAPQQRLGLMGRKHEVGPLSFVSGFTKHPFSSPKESAPETKPGVSYETDDRATPRLRELEREDPQTLHQERQRFEEALKKSRGNATAQVVRSRSDQTLHGAQEKEIKDAYLNAVQYANNFILIVNQYFQYSKLARQIKYWKGVTNDAFKQVMSKKGEEREPRILYLFLGTCKSEHHGQLFRSQQMANEFGVGDQYELAHNEMYNAQTEDPNTKKRDTTLFGDEMSAQTHVTAADMKALGIKPLFFMFYAPLPPEGSRAIDADNVAQQVYVHAKLMIQDDTVFTIGSANTNIRSFAVDSELNIISDDKESAINLRERLFREFVDIQASTAKYPNEPEKLQQAKLKAIHEKMTEIAEKNASNIKKREQIQGLIAKFNDERTAHVARLG